MAVFAPSRSLTLRCRLIRPLGKRSGGLMKSGAYRHSWDYIPGGLHRRLFNQLFYPPGYLKAEYFIARESGGSDDRPIEKGRIKTTYERTKERFRFPVVKAIWNVA